jgi:hypothetical protein
MKPAPKASLKRALEAMSRRGAVLIRENAAKRRWFVTSVGEVSDEIAATIRARPDVIGQKDALFPGLDQTFGMLRVPEQLQ